MQKHLLLLLILMGTSSIFAQTYVNQAATGSNDGSSWENAYTSLNVALDNTASGDIWIAAGTYKPDGGAIESSFEVKTQVNLYGGFDGTETSLDQRDLDVNETILSGDYSENDEGFDFDSLRNENAQTLIYIDSLLDKVTINGLHLTKANGSAVSETPDMIPLNERMWAGSGIFTYSSIDVSQVRMTLLSARRGGAIAVSGGATVGGDDSVIDMVSVRNCRSNSQSLIFMNGKSNCSVTNSEFVDNASTRGCVYPLRCSQFTVKGCNFESNADDGGWGGAMFSWNNIELLIEDSQFKDNFTSGSGGVMYLDGREDETGELEADNMIFRNCLFENNTSQGSGGALQTWQMSMTVENCTFDGNFAQGGDGGAFANYGNTGKSRFFEVNNTLFTKNRANFGGAMVSGGEGAEFNFVNCAFSDNNCDVSGGTMLTAFGANALFNGCTFTQDSASFGGTLAFQDNGTSVVNDCIFESNFASSNGGAINTILGHNLTLENSGFNLNITDGNGGVVNATNSSGSPIGDLTIINSDFSSNAASVQGGVINLGNHSMNSVSSIYAYNTAGSGAGGVISANGSDSFFITVNLINNTMFANFSQLGGAIGAFTDGTETAGATVTFQNNILHENSPNGVETEDGAPIYISNGGNLSSDDSTDDIFTGMNDISDGPDPDFHDPDELDFFLDEGSPAIDIGIAEGAPILDYNGVARVGAVDAGALEFDISIDVDEVLLENDGLLSIVPNPVSATMLFELDNKWTGNVEAQIVTINGQAIVTNNFYKDTKTQSFEWNVENLQSGFYLLIVRNNKEVITSKLIKH